MAFKTPLWSTSSSNNNGTTVSSNAAPSTTTARPPTRDGNALSQAQSQTQTQSQPPSNPNLRERKSSTFSRRSSFSSQRRRGSNATAGSASSDAIVTDATAPPALPYYAIAAAAKVANQHDGQNSGILSPSRPDTATADGYGSKMLSRTATNTSASGAAPPTPASGLPTGGFWAQHEAQALHQQVVDLANKRINFLDYLRKAHEGRRYWFNTYLFDKPDLSRMPFFDPRKLPRKATNFLLLGLSLPVISDLYSNTPTEYLRSLNLLLSEFDAFQQLHSDSASRARLPNMFRRPGVKSRRSTSNTDVHSIATDDSFGGQTPLGGNVPNSAPASVMNFAASESDLLPGEEYTHLLTPALPFEPDYFETFATLCDTLIDCYTRLLTLMPTPRECSMTLVDLFTKMDGRIKKTIFQGVIKEFEDSSRASIKSEVASIGKVVLGGLM